MFASLLLVAASTACEGPVSVEELARVVDVGETAWVVMDRVSFERSTAERRELLPCVDETIDTDLVILLHLHEALAWSLERRSDLGKAAFRSILASEPDWELPLDIAPAHHRLRGDFEAVQREAPEDPRRALALPSGGGSLLVDGVEIEAVPVERPFLAQVLDEQSEVVSTHYFTPGSDAAQGPSWLSPAPGTQRRVLGEGLVGRERTGLVMMGSGIGLGLLAGGLYGLAAYRAASLEKGDLGCEELAPRAGQINQLVVASAALGSVGVGVGVAGVVIRF